MKLHIEKIVEGSEIQYFIRDRTYEHYYKYNHLLTFFQINLGAIILRSVNEGWDEAALLEVRGLRIKLVHDDLLGPYLAVVGKEPEIQAKFDSLIQDILPMLEAIPRLPIKIINQTNIPLYLSIDEERYYLKPGKVLSGINAPIPQKEYLIIAKNDSGDTIYSNKYVVKELSSVAIQELVIKNPQKTSWFKFW
jgi:hypothetical protein